MCHNWLLLLLLLLLLLISTLSITYDAAEYYLNVIKRYP